MLASLLISSVVVSVIALLFARWEYRRFGALSLLGLFGLCAMLFMPNLLIDYATGYAWPSTVLDWVGVVIGGFGLAVCLISIVFFRSLQKVLCLDAGELTVTGLYRFSRNPQYVGWWLFLLGFCLNDWSWWCGGALAVVAVSLHMLVLIEEEHLSRVFGEPYDAFLKAIPRYAGRRRSKE